MKRVLLAGLLGGLVLIVWLIVVDGLLGFSRAIDMKQLPEERVVYAFLVEHVKETGRYVLNPEVLPEQEFPGDDPIFGLHYTGLGHDDAGQEMLVGLVVMLLAPIAGAYLLANSSDRTLSKYGRRVAFFAMIGVVAALLGLMARFGLARYSPVDASAWAVHDLAAWVLAGLVVSRLIRPAAEH
ncbi:MAG: hypothetical protein PVF95_14490 [bacterium]